MDYKKLPYRMGAIGIVFDSENNVLIVQLIDYSDDEWNLPGGGRLEGEDGRLNILRELTEELGINQRYFKVVAKSSHDVKYDFPDDMREKKMPIALAYRGQIKEQYFVEFVGNKKMIHINKEELKNHKWVPANELKKYLIFDGQYEALKMTLDEYAALKKR